jgi:hypothetical protein
MSQSTGIEAPAHAVPPSLIDWPAPSASPDAPTAQLDALAQLGELISSSHSPCADLMPHARRLTEQAGGHRLAPGHFCAVLLDVSDRIGRVPPATWLSICRGLALGASIPHQGALPLPLSQAARRLLSTLSLPAARRLAMAQALMLDPA